MNTSLVLACRACALAGLAAALAGPAAAQAPAASSPASSASAPPGGRTTTLAPVLITGNPLGSREIAAPATVLTGDELVLRGAGSLGETLNGLPGVSATYFGPNASRPVIRGLDGDRVRVLSNAGASLDASSLSFDHAVPIDPLVVERIEVLRGPGALLYGGSAIGGVVNAIDNRIPKYGLDGVSGTSELRFGGAESERGGAALVEAGNGSLAFHADAFGRKTSDLSVPRYTPVEADGTVLAPTRRIRNSAARTDGGALGTSYTFGSGYLGAAVDGYDSRYGTVAEADVIIRMKRQHAALAGEVRDLSGPLRTLRFQLNDTRYRHEEIEGSGAIGTTFRSSGTEARVEAEHAAIGPLKGVVGAQLESVAFSALGEEAFVPTTSTRRRALFLLEEWASPVGALSGGLRWEQARVASDGDADPDAAKFGPAARRDFSMLSASLGNVWKLDAAWSLSGSVSTTARNPTSFELFANGVHAATGAFERGDPGLGVERGNNVDLALQWKSGADHVRLGAWAARFSRFISLEASGTTIVAGTDSFPEFVFRPVRASLNGFEIEASHRVPAGDWILDLSGKIDHTRASNRDSGEPLPRIAPLRSTLGLDAGTGPWLARVEVEAAARQGRVPAYDRPTAGYVLVNLALTRRFQLGGLDALAFLKASNVGDVLAYSAATVETIRGLVPLPGRALKAGLRVAF